MNALVQAASALATPIDTFVKKISKGAGILYEPKRIVRRATAEGQAAILAAEARVAVNEIEQRAFVRFLTEETRKQENIEAIIEQSIPLLKTTAKPEEVEDDWVAYFFDRSKLTSDEQMRLLWAKILAGEANQSGSFSRNTLDIVSKISKKDAELFVQLCRFCWVLDVPTAIIDDQHEDICEKHGLTLYNLMHLDALGLIRFQKGTLCLDNLPAKGKARYFNRLIDLTFPPKAQLRVGHCILTDTGRQLFNVCSAEALDEFYESTIKDWTEQGFHPTTRL